MPYQLSRPYLKDRREPLAGVGPHGYFFVEGQWFDHTDLADDAYGNRLTEPGMIVMWNTVAKKLQVYDHKNGSPDYEPVGICVDHFDVRNGDVAMNPVNRGKAIAARCWCANTGGTDPLTGAALVTALKTRITAGHFELIGLEWV